jgi:glucose-6-phosphate 1-dehydrogenase
MKPDASITITMQAKKPGVEMVSHAVDMVVADGPAAPSSAHLPGAYERLIADALVGDQRLFTRKDGVIETWRVIDPILYDQAPAKLYRAGSWGPDEARRFVPRGCGSV